ncbi:4Fe-4S binding protein [Shewanella nanhaiensis]|uniref:4Fe-4S binding protein n=1 Tax=Shewanella nanhaiensis TaxID=2864872 RepID=UPI003F699355
MALLRWIRLGHFPNFSLLLMLTLPFIPPISFANSDVTEIPTEIIHLFPTATRIGLQDKELPVTPVYQLNQLLGYVFETDELTDFIGFSGESINLLIGLDTKGVMTGLQVIKHHEPIFLHGLGESFMFSFVEQYKGHSVKERFIINSQDKTSQQATYFDGVTRATVSVMVINDTILASALKVARAKLEGFVAASPYVIKQDYFSPMGFDELLESGYLQHWQSSQTELNALPGELINEIEQLTEESELAGELHFIDLYFGVANIPIIGKNLLGEREYQRLLESLKPGEYALMLLNRGQYSFINKEFIPQTVSNRLSAVQNGFPVDLRDIDFYSFSEPLFNTDMPEFSDIKVFRIKSQSGFELHSQFELGLSLFYNQSFLSQKQHKFLYQVQLPEQLFVKQISPDTLIPQTPLWLTIWQSRQIEIAVTILYLFLLTLIFIKQQSLASNAKLTHSIRNLALLFVVGFIGFYSQGQLSVVNIYTLLLSIVNGFQLEVFLFDPIIFILWVFVFVTLFLWGRGLFCGWLCPFGALQEFMALLAQKLNIKQIQVNPKADMYGRMLKYLILFTLVATAFYSLTLAEQLAEVEPFKTSITLNFIRYWPFTLYAIVLLLLSLKLHKFYCRYLCPLGAGLALLGRYPLFKWLTRRKECGAPCHLCQRKKCGIEAINNNGSINYSECIQCLECLVTIESPKLCVVDRYGQKGSKPTRVKPVSDNKGVIYCTKSEV